MGPKTLEICEGLYIFARVCCAGSRAVAAANVYRVGQIGASCLLRKCARARVRVCVTVFLFPTSVDEQQCELAESNIVNTSSIFRDISTAGRRRRQVAFYRGRIILYGSNSYVK